MNYVEPCLLRASVSVETLDEPSKKTKPKGFKKSARGSNLMPKSQVMLVPLGPKFRKHLGLSRIFPPKKRGIDCGIPQRHELLDDLTCISVPLRVCLGQGEISILKLRCSRQGLSSCFIVLGKLEGCACPNQSLF